MKKWLVLTAVLLLVLLGFVVAGPYLAIRGIDSAVQERRYSDLERYVDFPVLRGNVKAQIEDRLARAYGQQTRNSLFGSAAMTVAQQAGDNAVDMMVSPTGIAILLNGDTLVRQVADAAATGDVPGSVPVASRTEPLRAARTRFESLARFTATASNRKGEQMVFVFSRKGLVWKLTDIRMPART